MQTDVLFVPTIEKGISYYGSLAKFERMYTNSYLETYMTRFSSTTDDVGRYSKYSVVVEVRKFIQLKWIIKGRLYPLLRHLLWPK